jgi:spermidine synthase
MRIHLLTPLLFLSGAAALVLEVAWFRRTAQIAGGTAVAMAAVLAAVIGGMALGSFLLGRTADRVRSPLKMYGLLEIGIALGAILSPVLLGWSEGLFSFLYGSLSGSPVLLTGARFLLAVILLTPPAILMGGSLPAAAAALRAPEASRGSGIGSLYAANTIGAVCGTLAAGFMLLPALGLAHTMWCAALLSGGAGLVAILMSRGSTAGEAAASGSEAAGVSSADARRAIILYAVSGFLGLVAEVAFARSLVLVFGSTTYAFSTMLAVFLLGIGLGSLIGSRLARRPERHLRRLETTLVATAALFSLATLVVYLLPRLYLELYLSMGQSFTAGFWLRFLLAAIVLLPGSIGLGIAFPLAVHLAAGARATGEGTGRLYAANTLCSILGSTLAVFVLVPKLGPQYAIVTVALVAGCVAAWRTRRPLLLGLLGLTAVGFLPPPEKARERLMAGVYFTPSSFLLGGEIDEASWDAGVDIPFTVHGRDATVSIWRWYGLSSMLVNGKAVASNQILSDDHHLMLLGHLPMLIHENPQRVLVVGLGMGTTYRAVAMHEPQSVRVVEIEEAVVEAAAWIGFKPADVVIADARTYVKATDERFDVITSDPIHPWVRGGGDLYSREYLLACRDRLAPGGVVCQWLPVYQMGLDDVRDVARTFASVFTTAVYYGGGGDLVLVGVDADRVPDPRRPAANLLDAVLEADLKILRIAGHERLAEAVGDGPVVTDDSLRLEFSVPHHLASPELPESLAWIQDLWGNPPSPYDRLLCAQWERALGNRDAEQDHLEAALAAAPGSGFVRRYTGEIYLSEANSHIRSANPDAAAIWLAPAKSLLPDDPRILGAEADLAALRGDVELAKKLYWELLDETPDSVYIRRKLKKLE